MTLVLSFFFRLWNRKLRHKKSFFQSSAFRLSLNYFVLAINFGFEFNNKLLTSTGKNVEIFINLHILVSNTSNHKQSVSCLQINLKHFQ